MHSGHKSRGSLLALLIAAVLLTPAGTAQAEGGLGGLDPVVEAGDQSVTGTVDTVEKTVDKTVDTVDKTVDTADKTVDRTVATVETVVSEVEEAADDTQERVKSTADKADATVTEASDTASEPIATEEPEASEAPATKGSDSKAVSETNGSQGTDKRRPHKAKGRPNKVKRDARSRSRATEIIPVITEPDPAGPMIGPGVYQPISYEAPTRPRRPTAAGFDLGVLPFTGYPVIQALLASGLAIAIGLILILTGRWRRAPRLPTGLWTEAPSAATGTLR